MKCAFAKGCDDKKKERQRPGITPCRPLTGKGRLAVKRALPTWELGSRAATSQGLESHCRRAAACRPPRVGMTLLSAPVILGAFCTSARQDLQLFAAPCNYCKQVFCRSGSTLAARTPYVSLIRMSTPLQPAAACWTRAPWMPPETTQREWQIEKRENRADCQRIPEDSLSLCFQTNASASCLLFSKWNKPLPASFCQRAARSEAHSSNLADVGSRSMQLPLEHLSRTFALQSSETHCCRWPLSLQSSRWRATSSCRDDVSVWACGSSSILHCGTTGLAFNFRFTAFSDPTRPIEHASATSCWLLDSQTWNRQEEGRREAGGRVCCAAARHAVTSLRSNLNKT